jgi:hypothetical protein
VTSLLLFALACASGSDSSDTAGEFAPTLVNVQAEVFDKSCAFSTCHGDGGGSGNLSLTPGNSRANLVGVPADGDPLQTRVVPADPDGSYIVMKLEAATGIVGDPMPDVALDDERVALVRAWIAAGAEDN